MPDNRSDWGAPGRRARLVIGAMWVLSAAGCQTYEPMPITDEVVDQALKMPDAETISAAASSFSHPLIEAVEVNLEDGVSPDEAAVLAVLFNHELVAVRSGRGLAAAQIVEASVLPNPSISAGFDAPAFGITADTVTAWNVGAGYDLKSLFSHDARVSAAQSHADAVDLEIAWREWLTAQAARRAVYDLLSLDAQLATLRDAQRGLEENLQAVQRGYEAHEHTTVDLSAVRAAVLDAQLATQEAEAQRRLEVLELKRLLGFPASVELAVANDDLTALEAPLPDRETLGAEAMEQRIDLRALRYGYDSQEEALRAAIIEQFPAVNIGFLTASDTSEVGTIGLGITIDLPIFDQNQGAIATERATRQALYDEFLQRAYDARIDVAAAIERLGSLRERLATMDKAIPQLEDLLDEYQAGVEQRNANIITYYQLYNDLTQKRLQREQLRREAIDAFIALELASGRSLSPRPEAAEDAEP